jgi:uncharacterized damage-inducible protein DinB
MERAPALRAPDVDPELLLAQLEYARWATQKILDRVDQLPPCALTHPVVSSFPTLLATLQHVYGWDKYYLIHLQGGHAERQSISEPSTYEELKRQWATLHREMISWAKENLGTRKDVVLDGWGMWPTWMIVMQIANHGTHHFGQVVTLLRQLGYMPQIKDSTDAIRYYLRRYPQENQKARLKSLLDGDTTPVEAPM